MKIRTNRIMDRTLAQKGYDFSGQAVQLPPGLEELVDAGFRNEADCLLWKHVRFFGSGVAVSDFKKTEYEDFENHIHIEDYTSEVTDEFEYLSVGLEFAKRLYNRLSETYPCRFRTTVSFRETTYERDDIAAFGSCVVRFHVVRPSCDAIFRIDDLDSYEAEAVLVIE